MPAEEYTKLINEMVERALVELRTISDLMKGQGDETRAMDIDEAIGYVEASVEEI